jgi:hypothetical protein
MPYIIFRIQIAVSVSFVANNFILSKSFLFCIKNLFYRKIYEGKFFKLLEPLFLAPMYTYLHF